MIITIPSSPSIVNRNSWGRFPIGDNYLITPPLAILRLISSALRFLEHIHLYHHLRCDRTLATFSGGN
ncbi:hypothetical protein SPLC1_S420200 [Arthrospira platensis C1]|nr:hypothetical protein SPLC1_S420200 [Arthrospira platensis C1]